MVVRCTKMTSEAEPNQPEHEFYYRYEDRMYAGCTLTEWGSEHYYTVGPELKLLTFRVIKHTPQGAWIEPWFGEMFTLRGEKRWVSNYARKRYALPTKQEALHSFCCRKQRQISIYEARADTAKRALRLAEREMEGLNARTGLCHNC